METKKLKYNNLTLNITAYLSNQLWGKIPLIYERMPGWLGFKDHGINKGIPYWFSFDENEIHISASSEMSGLLLEGKMDEEEWIKWIKEFKLNASEILDFKVEEIDL